MRNNTPAEVTPDLYDHYVKDHTQVWNDHLIERVVSEISHLKSAERKLLDIGTGTARTLITMSAMPEFSNFQFIGVDYFQEMVDKARQNVSNSKLNYKITIDHGDVHKLPYPDEFVDVAIGRSIIHHFADPIRAFKEIFRVLKKDGIVIIHEPCRDPSDEALQVFNAARKNSGIHGINLHDKYTIPEVKDQLKQAGILDRCSILQGKGIDAIGFEVLIKK